MGKNHGKHGAKTNVSKMTSLLKRTENELLKLKEQDRTKNSNKKKKTK